MKNKNCSLCGAISFVSVYKNQPYCDDCMKGRSVEDEVVSRKFNNGKENNEKSIL